MGDHQEIQEIHSKKLIGFVSHHPPAITYAVWEYEITMVDGQRGVFWQTLPEASDGTYVATQSMLTESPIVQYSPERILLPSCIAYREGFGKLPAREGLPTQDEIEYQAALRNLQMLKALQDQLSGEQENQE